MGISTLFAIATCPFFIDKNLSKSTKVSAIATASPFKLLITTIEPDSNSVEEDTRPMGFENRINIKENLDVPADARLPTKYGEFRIRVFHEEDTGLDHVALTLGEMDGPDRNYYATSSY